MLARTLTLILLFGACTNVVENIDEPAPEPTQPEQPEQAQDPSASNTRGKRTTTTPAPPPAPEVCTADTSSDPNNCGACGNVCGSGLCYAGVCADAVAGHVFAIGHGYATSNGALDRALGNAVFVTERNPVRVLAFHGSATAAMISGTDAAISRTATARGRTWQKTTVAGSSGIATGIANADVVLIYPQPAASDAYLLALANEWSLPFDDFTRRGGVIVVLDAPSANAGTAQVLPSSLLSVSGRTTAPGSLGYVAAYEDAAAVRMPLTFALASSVGWLSTTGVKTATSETGHAVVVHRAIY